jgi:kynureninase
VPTLRDNTPAWGRILSPLADTSLQSETPRALTAPRCGTLVFVTRDHATIADSADPLAGYRANFAIPDPDLIYLDGNSLGRLTIEAVESIETALHEEWGGGLVRSWRDEWIGLPEQIGDLLAPVIGAAAGEVLVTDQTSVNLFKLAAAALQASGRTDVVSDDSNFPSDLYVLDAVARAAGGRLRIASVDPATGLTVDELTPLLDNDAGVVSISHVGFKTGALADIGAVTAATHAAGALALWDLSHSAGVVPVGLNANNVDLAVGCTYKYLNGGPGAPAFLYVRDDLQEGLSTPIPGWFGHADMFAFDPEYSPAPGIRRFAAGTPPILSLRGAQAGIALSAAAGIEAIRAKSVQLTEFLIARFDVRLANRGFTLGSPRNPDHRGGHVSLRHPDAYPIAQALIDRNVIPDFRAPDTIRLGLAPLYTTFTDVWDAVEVIATVVVSGVYRDYPTEPDGVT